MNIQQLQLENMELKRKLKIAEMWMEREVRFQVEKIANFHNEWVTFEESENRKEYSEEYITEQITEFIWEVLMLNVPATFMENVISAEIQYHSLEDNHNFDGLWVISSYHKALDVLIENFITKGFRKYAHKQNQTQLRKNDVLEKTLNSVVNKGYILGVGRFYHLLKLIKEDWELHDYGKCFKDYIEKYNYLWEVFLENNFYKCLSKLVNSDILWKKRHVWKISFEETKLARSLLIWDFENTESVIYKLIETQKIEC